jgi:hypothetical protein
MGGYRGIGRWSGVGESICFGDCAFPMTWIVARRARWSTPRSRSRGARERKGEDVGRARAPNDPPHWRFAIVKTTTRAHKGPPTETTQFAGQGSRADRRRPRRPPERTWRGRCESASLASAAARGSVGPKGRRLTWSVRDTSRVGRRCPGAVLRSHCVRRAPHPRNLRP